MKTRAPRKQSSNRRLSSRKPKRKSAASPSPERLMQFAWGFAPTFILEAATKLRVFDNLDKSAKTVEELARETGCSIRGLTALLDALVAFQFLKRKGNRYSLTPESSTFLVSTSPDYHGGFFRQLTGQVMTDWTQLAEVVRTGEPAKSVNHEDVGADFFAELVEGIFPMSYRAAQVLGKHLRIEKIPRPVTVLDVGAGSGVWGIALAQQSQNVNILAVDWPKVLEVTRRTFGRYSLAERLQTSAGDFFEANFGSGHYLATIGHILHSEGRTRSRQLLKKVFDALPRGGTVAIAEFIPNNDRTGPPNALMFGMNSAIA